MLPGFLTKTIELLPGREGRSLHVKAAGSATAALIVTMPAGSWAAVAAESGTKGATLTSYPKALW